MSKRKDDDKAEKTIRGLLRLPENRRCINCQSLGPQYICTTFLTFVCTNCSGVHREFTHRVKSISMSKFNAEEVHSLQAGGNERARQIYFRSWDSQRNTYPDGSNLQRLRDFIKHVYVERRFDGDSNSERLPRLRLDEVQHRRKLGPSLEGFRSPGIERSVSERIPTGKRSDSFSYYYDERRSPRYNPENLRSGGYKRSPVRFEIVDDRFREDGTGSARARRSLDSAANLDPSRSPEVHHGSDNPLALQVGGNSTRRGEGSSDNLARNQHSESALSVTTTNTNPVEKKEEQLENLINPDTNSEPSGALVPVQPDQVTTSKKDDNPPPQAPKMTTLEALLFELSPGMVPVSNTFEIPGSNDAPQTPPAAGNVNTGPVDILSAPLLRQASGISRNDAPPTPPAAGIVTTGAVDILSAPRSRQASGITRTDNTSTTASAQVSPQQHPGSCPPQTMHDCRVPNGHQLPNVQQYQPFSPTCNNWNPAVRGPEPQQVQSVRLNHQQSFSRDNIGNYTVNNPEVQQPPLQNLFSYSPATDANATMQHPMTPATNLFDQQPASPVVHNVETPRSSVVQSPKAVSQSAPAQDTGPTPAVQNPPGRTSSFSDRKELPVDLFTGSYPSVNVPLQAWQNPAIHGMRPNMQYYHRNMSMKGFQNSPKCTNPFDVNNGTAQGQTSQFPFMVPLQEALPNTSPHGYNYGNQQYSGYMASHSPSYASTMHEQSPTYASTIHQQAPTYASTMHQQSPNYAYIGQQQMHYNNQPIRQGSGGFGSNGAVYGSMDGTQQFSNGYPSPNSANSYTPRGRNPFE